MSFRERWDEFQAQRLGKYVLGALTVCALTVLLVVLLFTGGLAYVSRQMRPWMGPVPGEVVPPAALIVSRPGPGDVVGPTGSLGSTGSTRTLTPDEKMQLQQDVLAAQNALIAEIRANDANQHAILDRLATLIGVYSAILALTAFATVRFAREDAAAQLKRASDDLDAYKDAASRDLTTFRENALADIGKLQEDTRNELGKLKDNTKAQLETFKSDIWSELPEMRGLKDNLRKLLRELEGSIPPSLNSNVEAAYGNLTESQRQKFLISEGVVNALQIFVPEGGAENKEPLARLYHSLARFYFGRYRKNQLALVETERALNKALSQAGVPAAQGEGSPTQPELAPVRFNFDLYRKEKASIADAERADLYADRSLRLQPDNAYAYVLRGTLALARYTLLKGASATAPKREQLERLLLDAREFLDCAREINPTDIGALYNLALAYSWQNHLPERSRSPARR